MGYTRDTFKGISWVAVLRVTTRIFAFIETIILARILSPAQFGAYGIALLLLGFLEVMTESGVNVILIQNYKIDTLIDSAFIVSIIRGILIALILVLITPFIASFFNSTYSIPLLYLISIAPLLRGFINPSIIKFQKELNFKSEFYYRGIIIFFDTLVSIGVTLYTHNPIGIVYGLLTGIVIELILSYFIVKPIPHFKYHKKYFRMLLQKGKWITASGIFNYIFHNIDNFVVGRFLNASSLGIYQMAYTIAIIPITEIADVFSKVTFPVFTKIGNDKKRLKLAFTKITITIAMLSVPFAAVLLFFPKVLIHFVLGDKWLAIVPILPILAIFGAVRAISGSISTLFLAIGRQEYVSVAMFASSLGIIITIVPLVIKFGLYGASLAALIGAITAIPVFVYYTRKIFN